MGNRDQEYTSSLSMPGANQSPPQGCIPQIQVDQTARHRIRNRRVGLSAHRQRLESGPKRISGSRRRVGCPDGDVPRGSSTGSTGLSPHGAEDSHNFQLGLHWKPVCGRPATHHGGLSVAKRSRGRGVSCGQRPSALKRCIVILELLSPDRPWPVGYCLPRTGCPVLEREEGPVVERG